MTEKDNQLMEKLLVLMEKYLSEDVNLNNSEIADKIIEEIKRTYDF